ncbi:unnamed protein product [Rotaria socialis]|uniref:diacylglycerol cholinephosphotransferase n=2 Tax=Rotaria socialis TaxID=392032 RepID=A0A818L2R0_9BILA|nr:unnamed protein product [Rotaria socialis]CAF3361166.1 unnamed protein product [Rotaria socialis]CAF3566127.1 unnamed protein product [Rotaria socialis]CAF3660957.1 unnamed protein product [Rotaria socialis]CAF4106854.1 unnamed protein product [Rotaria socialis]
MDLGRHPHRSAHFSFRDNVRQIAERSHRLEANARQAIQRLPVVLNEQQIVRLKEHTYASEGITLLDPYMQKFWRRLVEYCPLWVAPNLITIVGLAINISASILLMFLTNGAKEPCARWMYFLTAIGLFIYQSLDAIDGKQARRTNSSTPLGELFDHGCDSVSTVFVTVACCCALQLGLRPWVMFWCCMSSFVTFYCAHWQTYVSGKLRFGKLDCTEAQFTFILVYLISTIDPRVWSATMPIINIEYRVLVAFSAICSAIWSSANNINIISKGGCGRHYSSVAGSSIIYPILPMIFLMLLAITAGYRSISNVLEEHTSLLLVCYGIVFSKITNRLIVAHMSKSLLNSWDWAYMGPIAICVNQYLNCLISEEIFFWFFLIYNLFDLLRYNIKVCQELCDALNIYCFRITPSTVLIADGSH